MQIQNIQKSKHFDNELEGEILFPLFNRVIKVHHLTNENIDYANQCAKLLSELNEETVSHLCQASILYCNDFLFDVGEDMKEFEDEKQVLSLIQPTTLIIPTESNKQPVIHLELECDWEEEHGMEWIIRDSKVEYVGAFEGNYPFHDFSNEPWNFAYQVE